MGDVPVLFTTEEPASGDELLIQHCVCDQTPFLLCNGASEWPAIRGWSWDYLKTRIGQQTISVFPRFDPTCPGPVSDGVKVEMTFSDYIDRIIAGTASELGYVTQHEMLGALPRLLPDISIPKLVPLPLLLEINLWLAFAGKVTPLHFDFYHTALVQVIGRKKVFLAAPTEYERLDFFEPGSRSERRSRSPLSLQEFAKSELYEVELQPGDLLFIPAFWAHETRAMDSSVGVSFWWRAELAMVLGCPGLSVAFAEEATLREPGRLLRLFELRTASDLVRILEALFAIGRMDEARLLLRGALRELDRLLGGTPEEQSDIRRLTVLSDFARMDLASALGRLS
jgi:lysine-specific demethylase 8